MQKIVVFLLLSCLFCTPVLRQAFAGTAEARDAARLNNCTPKKIEVYKQAVGLDAQTIYRVGCVAAKTNEVQGPTVDSVLIACNGGLCSLLRTMTANDK